MRSVIRGVCCVAFAMAAIASLFHGHPWAGFWFGVATFVMGDGI
jgi:hypothetical protein